MNTKFETMSEQLDEMDNDFALWYTLNNFIEENNAEMPTAAEIENMNMSHGEFLAYLERKRIMRNAKEIIDLLEFKLWR